jgi:hypothetical protein
MGSTHLEFSEITIGLRPELNPLFSRLDDGVSEFTFSNIYLFRKQHSYRISKLGDDSYIITGSEGEVNFFMLPFGLPETSILKELFSHYGCMKAVSEGQAKILKAMGFTVTEDRDNFDYIYLKEELEKLYGRKYHKKKNMVNAFIQNYEYEGRPLLPEYTEDVMAILEEWKRGRKDPGDYEAAREAVQLAEDLVLCGGIYYVNGKPAAFNLGEEIAGGTTFAIHFEKAIRGYKGLYQFVNMSFASILPQKYVYINREQDLGNEGLRQAKMSYKPHKFIKKYRATG